MLYEANLSELSTDGVISLLERIEDLKPAQKDLIPKLREHSINGRVLKHCDLNDLKDVNIILVSIFMFQLLF